MQAACVTLVEGGMENVSSYAPRVRVSSLTILSSRQLKIVRMDFLIYYVVIFLI